ncbi:hypothetical protein BHE74_00015278 [Ensete ventricosum]|nr:hypothetical protein BHE74_00015278 [Ensete ventricosum]
MWSNSNVDSSVTTRRLVEARNNYFIPPEYELHAPLPGERPYDVFPSGFSLSIDALEVGLRFPLHLVVEACLEGWQISPSQMAGSHTFSLSLIVRAGASRPSGPLERGVKDMNEAWLAEAGLSPAPRDLFFPFVIYAEFFLIVHYHAEMFNLGKMKSGGGAGSGSTVPSAVSKPAIVDVGVSTTEKHPSTGEAAGLRKHLRKPVPEQPADALGSTMSTPAEKGKGVVELKEVPEQGYTTRELCEEVGVLHSSLDGARNDRARLEGDVLLLTEAATFLEAELKAEGSKAVIAYKASRGFELGLEKMGRVSYEFEYRVALERLRGKHPEIVIKQDSFVECPDNANVEMDLNQPFDDNAPSEK